MKYRILSLGNQYKISQIQNGETKTVGKIIQKPNKSIFFRINNKEAKQTVRVMNEKLILKLTSEDYYLEAIKDNSNQQLMLNWKDRSNNDILLKCKNYNGFYYLQVNNITLSKVKEITENQFQFEIIKSMDFTPVIQLACLFPLFYS